MAVITDRRRIARIGASVASRASSRDRMAKAALALLLLLLVGLVLAFTLSMYFSPATIAPHLGLR
jgi:hypothetical protein